MAANNIYVKNEYVETCTNQGYFELLEFLQNNPVVSGEGIFEKRQDRVTLCEFSHCRSNIISWMDIPFGANILEIGAGAGAVSSYLVDRCIHIDCIEESLVKTRINKLRNADSSKMTFYVGTIEDWIEVLTENAPYDYIIVWKADKADFDRTSQYRKALKAGGRLVLSADNRYGLKYFAGCRQNENDELFANITKGGFGVKYEDVKGLINMRLNSLLMDDSIRARIYYPYPDADFTKVIFSPERMPETGELSENDYVFAGSRIKLFDETAAFDHLIEDDKFAEFSNAYLLVIDNTRPETNGEMYKLLKGSNPFAKNNESQHLAYTKFSNERDPRFNIRTDLYISDTGARYICKVPYGNEAEKHVRDLSAIQKRTEELFDGTNLGVNNCVYDGSAAWFEYLSGVSMDKVMDYYVECNDREGLLSMVDSYCSLIRGIYGRDNFAATDEFIRIFGDVSLPEGLKGCRFVDVDLIFQNMISDGHTWHVIDYEWTLDVLLPANYVIYRSLFFYMLNHPGRAAVLGNDIYERCGVSPEEMPAYSAMEERFQAYTKGAYTPVVSKLIQSGDWDSKNLAQVFEWYEILSEENEILRSDNDILRSKLEEVKSSAAWKLTKPFRRG